MAEFVIVGGGVYGAGVAWHLARRGCEVVLLEKRTVASGASGGPGRRGVRANSRDLRELPLMVEAYETWPRLHEALGAAPFYERTGHLLLIEREEDLPPARARTLLQSANGIESRLIGRDELREMEPHLADRFLGALHCPEDGVADHTAATRAMAEAARRSGAVIRQSTVAVKVLSRGERAVGVLTAEEETIAVERGLLLLANSAVAGLVERSFGIALPTWNRPTLVMLTEPLASVPLRHLIGHAHRIVSLKAHERDRVMISGGWPGRWDARAERGEAIQASIDANWRETLALYPQLEGSRIAVADAGHLESNAIDDIPVIDTVPGIPNCWFAAGWCGHGWAIAPVVARHLADWALSGERPAALQPFGYPRFGM